MSVKRVSNDETILTLYFIKFFFFFFFFGNIADKMVSTKNLQILFILLKKKHASCIGNKTKELRNALIVKNLLHLYCSNHSKTVKNETKTKELKENFLNSKSHDSKTCIIRTELCQLKKVLLVNTVYNLNLLDLEYYKIGKQ